MNGQFASLAEALATYAAHKRLLAGMGVNVLFEILAEDERLLAIVAFERTLIKMGC